MFNLEFFSCQHHHTMKKYFVMCFILSRMKNDIPKTSRVFFFLFLFFLPKKRCGFNFHHFTWSFCSNGEERNSHLPYLFKFDLFRTLNYTSCVVFKCLLWLLLVKRKAGRKLSLLLLFLLMFFCLS